MVQLETLRILSSVAMLGYSSWSDLRTREVSDLTWLVFGGAGLVMNIYDLSTGLDALGLALPVLLSAGMASALLYLRLFGGADFKAFVVLSLLQPYPPRTVRPALGLVSAIYPLTVFSNSALAGASMALVLVAVNLSSARRGRHLFEGHESEPTWRRLVVLATGLRVRLDSVRGPPFQYPLEELVAGGAARRFRLMPDIEDDRSAWEAFERLRGAGLSEVWVSQTLPFIVFIAVGFLAALFVGDVVLWALAGALPM